MLAINAISSSSSSQAISTMLTIVFTLVTLAVGLLIAYASYVPVRKVVAMEPGDALHYE